MILRGDQGCVTFAPLHQQPPSPCHLPEPQCTCFTFSAAFVACRPDMHVIHRIKTTTPMIGKLRSLPDLNFDILLQIISLLTRQDVACITRTCHTLRIALSAELPREGVTLEGRHLTSFLQFVSVKDGRDRLSYFNRLVLPGLTYDAALSSGEQGISMRDVKQGLLGILKLAARNLESLSILDLDAFSFRPLELKKVLDSLPNLRELEISGVDKKNQNPLAGTLRHLRTLTLSFLEDETNASPFFKVPQSSLEELTLRNGTFKDTSISLPTVHTLRACPMMFPSDVDAYTRIFPNVRDVILDFPRDYARMDPEFRKRIPSCHPAIEWPSPHNEPWRAAFLHRAQKKADAWPHIQSLRAVGHGAGKLSWAGLTCQVPRVEVCSLRFLNDPLEGALSELRPRCVVFHPGSFHGPWKDQPWGWGQLRGFQAAPFATRLVVVVCQSIRDYVHQEVWLVRRGGL